MAGNDVARSSNSGSESRVAVSTAYEERLITSVFGHDLS